MFEIEYHFIPGLVWTSVLLFVLPHVTGMIDHWLRWGLANFLCPGLPETAIFLISTSGVARTGLIHCARLVE
jgi:hypothetical protein